MTFSLVARCRQTGMLGGAVSSSSPAVGSRCLFTTAGVGAALTQNFTDPLLGQQALALLAHGATAAQALDIVVANAEQADWRQLALIAPHGAPACFTGAQCLERKAMTLGSDCVAVGNLLADTRVTQAMVASFEASSGHLAARLVAAMQAGLAAGGETEAVHSAGLMVSHQQPWPIVNLRIDWTDGDPIAELAALWQRWEVVMPTYISRALTPQSAPAADPAISPVNAPAP